MLLIGLVLDTATITALIAANPVIAAVLACAVGLVIYKQWPNIKDVWNRVTGNGTTATTGVAATTQTTASADGSQTTSTQTTKTTGLSSLFPSITNVIDEIANSPLAQKLELDRNLIIQMGFSDVMQVGSNWIQNQSGFDDATKQEALAHSTALSAILSRPAGVAADGSPIVTNTQPVLVPTTNATVTGTKVL